LAKDIAWGGIDPGVDGCACLLTKDIIWLHDFDLVRETLDDDRHAISCELKAADLIEQWHAEYQVRFMLEKISVVKIPDYTNKAGKKIRGYTGGTKLLRSYGFWRGVLTSNRCNWTERTPAQWRKVMPGKKPKNIDWKDHALFYAKYFYPVAGGKLARKKDHTRAEALLMAHCLRQTEKGF
jgi:hypothetical protein